MRVLLYVTDACSFCDTALDLLFAMPELAGYLLEAVDIASDDVLFDRFGELIPVVEIADQQLAWPFTENDISNLIRKASSRSLE